MSENCPRLNFIQRELVQLKLRHDVPLVFDHQ